MLQITIDKFESWDEKNQEFIYGAETTIALEHSLVSLSKWESKWHVPFLSKNEKTTEQIIDYIKCMTITQNVNFEIYNHISNENLKKINDYMENPMTATWFNEQSKSSGGKSEQVTSELIYYWMISLQIPFECQKWHLNRLLTLIHVCNNKNKPAKKYSKRDILSTNAAINAARRKSLGTTG